jgi:uncharacterized RDD family membrane protein YckC
MSVIRIPTSFNIDVEFEIPEFYKRLLALVVDILIEYVYLRIISAIMRSVMLNSFDNGDSGFNLETLWLLLILPIMLYHLIWELSMNGQSPGKKLAGIRVVNENGGRPSVSQFLIRWLLRVSDMWMVIIIYLLIRYPEIFGQSLESTFIITAALSFLIADIVLVITTKKSQRIGDILAKTILINVRTRFNIEDTVFREVDENYVPVFPQIMQLSDKDVNAIKSILENAKKRNDHFLAEQAAVKIKSHLHIETSLSAIDFLDVLMKDYNYLSVN